MLNKRAGKTTLLWIPGHHVIAGIEEVDVCTKHASAITDGAPRPVSFAAANTLMGSPPSHCRTKEFSTKTFSWQADHSHRLPTSWSHPLLKAYVKQLDTTVDPKCPSCGEDPQTVEHWLQRCPNAVALRQQLFGEPSPPLSVLTTNPDRVLALSRKTLL